jgi:predicted dehydrogenase
VLREVELTIGVGLVGYGYWGSNLARALQEAPAMELRTICDSRPDALRLASRRAPDIRQSTSFEDTLSDDSITALVIATPVASHFELATAALSAGKHVLVEKPLAATAAEAEALCITARDTGPQLMVGHTFLYNGAVRRIREMISAGELGDIRYVFCQRLNLGVVRDDVDALWNLAPHDISMLDYWIGRPVIDAAAVGHSYLQSGISDVVFAHLTFEGGAAGHVHVSWLDPIKVRRVTVVGSRRMLVYDDVAADNRIAVYDKGVDIANLESSLGEYSTYAEHRLKIRAGDVWLPRIEYPEPLAVEMQEFADCILEDRPALTDGANGLRVVQILEQISSKMTGRK